MSEITERMPTLDLVRGSLERARGNARSVAALTDNPGCTRRRVIDAAAVEAHTLAEKLGHPVTRGQSPFAIATGNQFERRLKTGSGYAQLIDALRPFVDLPAQPRVENLGRAPGQRVGQAWLEKRVQRTADVLVAIARNKPDAPHLVDHPVLRFDVAGAPVFLEPDALAFRTGNQLQLVEIKSYAVIDEQVDPNKLSATAGQAAVYLLALRATLAERHVDPDILRWSVILVAPRNFGRFPTAHEVPLKKKALALQRVLGSVPRTSELVNRLPTDFTFDVNPKKTLDETTARRRLNGAVTQLPMLYVPECLASCDMARFCRHQALATKEPAVLGRTARDALAGVPTLADALRLAAHGPRAGEEALKDVAEALGAAHEALARARARAGSSFGQATSASATTGRRSR